MKCSTSFGSLQEKVQYEQGLGGCGNRKLIKSLDSLTKGKTINVDFSSANLVDHTVMENLHNYQHDYEQDGGKYILGGMRHLYQQTYHPLSSRKKIFS